MEEIIRKIIQDKTILVTGGTGSIGKEIVKQVLKYSPKQIRIFSRDQSKQLFLNQELGHNQTMRYLIGDVRDKERVKMAMEGVDVVFHAAALKHVVSCEYNPFEAVKTNVVGLQNVIDAAIAEDVSNFVFISTDKAVDPTNVMGSTKALGEKLVSNAFYYKGKKKTLFSSVRFGNVLNSEGSVIPIWKRQIESGNEVTVTDPEMRRFFMSIPQAAELVLTALCYAQVNEIFVLKMPVMRISDLAEVVVENVAPKYGKRREDFKIKFTGKAEGEKLHEQLMTESESEGAYETDKFFIVRPTLLIPYKKEHIQPYNLPGARRINMNGAYNTNNSRLISKEEIKEMLKTEKII